MYVENSGFSILGGVDTKLFVFDSILRRVLKKVL